MMLHIVTVSLLLLLLPLAEQSCINDVRSSSAECRMMGSDEEGNELFDVECDCALRCSIKNPVCVEQEGMGTSGTLTCIKCVRGKKKKLPNRPKGSHRTKEGAQTEDGKTWEYYFHRFMVLLIIFASLACACGMVAAGAKGYRMLFYP